VTELHLYLAIGIPTLPCWSEFWPIQCRWVSVNARLGLLETRVELSPERSSIPTIASPVSKANWASP